MKKNYSIHSNLNNAFIKNIGSGNAFQIKIKTKCFSPILKKRARIFFFLANTFNLIENLKKQRFEKAPTSPNLLNVTNLYKRPVCLKSILVFYFPKIQHQIYNLAFFPRKSFIFQSLNKQTTTLLNDKKSFSTFESAFLSFENFCTQFKPVEPATLFVESLKKDFKMQTSDYNELLSQQNSNILKFKSTRVNKTQQDSTHFNSTQQKINPFKHKSSGNAEWAKTFIRANKLSKSSLNNSIKFKELDRAEKQAIYYQLRKLAPIAKKNKKRLPFLSSKKNRGVLDFKMATFLMLPVIISEFLILTFSYLFYLELGFSLLLSCLAAACVELFFMITSGSKRFILQSLRWAIFAYSAFTVCYSTYSNDPKISSHSQLKQQELKLLEFKLDQQKNISLQLAQQQKDIAADMKVYRNNEMVTLGRKRLSKEKALIQKNKDKNQLQIESLVGEINHLKHAQLDRNVFSKENLALVEVKSWSVMFFLTLIQLLSSICTNEFSHSFRKYSQKKKLKKLNRPTKGVLNGLAYSNLSIQ